MNNLTTLSMSQYGIWVNQQLNSDSPVYNLGAYLKIKGKIDHKLLQKSTDFLVNENDNLRLGFILKDDIPHQYIKPFIEIDVPLLSFSQTDNPMKEALDYVEKDMQIPFNLNNSPLFKFKLLVVEDNFNLLYVKFHHIIIDGWGCNILQKRLAVIYSSLYDNNDPPIVESYSYIDHIENEKKYLISNMFRNSLDYWNNKYINQISGPFKEFPIPKNTKLNGKISRKKIIFDNKRYDNITKFEHNYVTTKFQILLSVFFCYSLYISETERITIGTLTANRRNKKDRKTVGHYSDICPFTIKRDNNDTFLDLLKKVHTEFRETYRHQQITIGQIISLLKEKNINLNFDVLFSYEPYDNMEQYSQFNTEIVRVTPMMQSEPLWISIKEYKDDKHLEIIFDFQIEYFKFLPEDNLVNHFITLFDKCIASPDININQLNPITSEERHDIIHVFNKTKLNIPESKTIIQLFKDKVKKTPNKIAIECGNRLLSYEQLNIKSNQIANFLINKYSVKKNDHIGIILNRSENIAITQLGILKSGASYVSIDFNYPEERIKYILDDAKCNLIITDCDVYFPGYNFENLEYCFSESIIAPEISINPEQLAYNLYTSGSSGKPKGVMISHRNLLNFILSMKEKPGIEPEDKLLSVTTISFDIFGLELFLPLVAGATAIIAETEEIKDINKLVNLINNVNIMQATPSLWKLLIDSQWTGNNKLKILCGGEEMPKSFGNKLLHYGKEVWNMYGPTETTIWSSIYKVPEPIEHITIGKPIFNTHIYILNNELNLCPIGIPGEIHIGGEGVGLGYYNNKDLTSKKFIHNPFNTSKTLFKTGDIGLLLQDGNIKYLGRKDNQVKINGNRIELGEIESIILEHPLIKNSLVDLWKIDDNSKKLISYITIDNSNLELFNERIEKKHVENWEKAYTSIVYSNSNLNNSFSYQSFNQWKSSYSNEKIPFNEMKNWLDNTVNRVLINNPKNVLEIGCGEGNILKAIIQHIHSYCGCDISSRIISNLSEVVDSTSYKNKITLFHSSADNLTFAKNKLFDCIIINSVVQYFPSANYLLNVINEAISLLSEEGIVYIGDVRDERLLKTFHSSVQFKKASQSTKISTLRDKILNAINNENELLLSPDFFNNLIHFYPEISSIQTLSKEENNSNEISKFRYDVIIKKSTQIISNTHETFSYYNHSLEFILEHLNNSNDKIILYEDIPNKSLLDDLSIVNDIDSLDPSKEVRHISLNRQKIGFSPSDLYSLRDDNFDVIVIPKSIKNLSLVIGPKNSLKHFKTTTSSTSNTLKEVVNQHSRDNYNQMIIDELTSFISKKVPYFMIPNKWLIVDNLPLLPNGKIDRKKLPKPTTHQLVSKQEFLEPQTHIEIKIANIIKSVLKIDRISVYDNIFDLGADSLSSILILIKLNKAFNKNITINELIIKPTIFHISSIINNNSYIFADKVIDLKKEVLLPKDIVKRNYLYKENGVLLTGATGFLGAYILNELLINTKYDIYCLVRANSNDEGFIRVKENLQKYNLYSKDLIERLYIIPGDLSYDNLGLDSKKFENLSKKINHIIHNGAYVNHMLPYSALKNSNVKGTVEIIRLASLNNIKLHYISTLGVFNYSNASEIYNEESSIWEQEHPESKGYNATKCVAELICEEAKKRGLFVNIYRLGLLTGATDTAYFNKSDWLPSLIQSCIILDQYFKEMENWNVQGAPVNSVSNIIVRLLDSSKSSLKLHLVDPKPINIKSIFNLYNLSYKPLSDVSITNWIESLKSSISKNLPISVYAEQFFDYKEEELKSFSKDFSFITKNKLTVKHLSNLNIAPPLINKELIQNYLIKLSKGIKL